MKNQRIERDQKAEWIRNSKDQVRKKSKKREIRGSGNEITKDQKDQRGSTEQKHSKRT